jgi:hypothetical protein
MAGHDTARDAAEGYLAWLSISRGDDPAAECRRLTALLSSGETDAFMREWAGHVAAGEAVRVIMDAGLE